MKISRGLAVVSVVACTALNAGALTVPGSSNLWLAGMPDGTTAGLGFDTAPFQSPALAPFAFTPGDALTFDVTGSVNNVPEPSGLGPDGDLGFYVAPYGTPDHGIGSINAPLNSLIAVFLSDEQPDSSDAPEAIDFFTFGIDFDSVAPALKQPFFIGDGLNSSTRGVQSFIVPAGATRLFFGTIDGFQWGNNFGAFEVNLTPAPGAAAVVGALGMLSTRRRRN